MLWPKSWLKLIVEVWCRLLCLPAVGVSAASKATANTKSIATAIANTMAKVTVGRCTGTSILLFSIFIFLALFPSLFLRNFHFPLFDFNTVLVVIVVFLQFLFQFALFNVNFSLRCYVFLFLCCFSLLFCSQLLFLINTYRHINIR